MSIRSLLRTHRRQVAIHCCVIVGFLVVTLFVVEPLFDSLERFDRVPGEAQLHSFYLPAETDNIMYAFDIRAEDPRVMVIERGWAFIEGEDSKNSNVYVVLESPSHTYVFDTHSEERPDVTRHFEEMGLNLDHSGFMAFIPIRRIADGEYTIGIYIRKGDIEALRYTSRGITKSGGTIEVTG